MQRYSVVLRRLPLLIVRVGLLAILAGGPAAAFETIARQAFVMDVTTGATLLEKNADQLMGPASMSKMMTTHLAFELIQKGRLKLDQEFVVSDYAWRTGGAASGGSTMFLNPGQTVTVEDLLRSIIIQSGNDASIVLAEGIAGTEAAFAEMMNRSAREMGMTNTTFRNSTGLPHPEHLTTARDLALLAKHTIETFPEFYPMYAEREFTFNGIKQGNRNPLLYRTSGVDGLKTGHTQGSGFGLTASAVRGDRRLIMVLNGLPNMQSRADESARVLDWAFATFENYQLFAAEEAITTARVWYGTTPTVPLMSDGALVVTLPRVARPGMEVMLLYDEPLRAPLRRGEPVGIIRISAPDHPPLERPLVVGADVDKVGLFGRLRFTLEQLVGRLLN